MAQISINTGGLVHARIKKQHFSLTNNELDHINRKLTDLEGEIPKSALIELAISKSDNSFTGTIRIDLLNLYSFGKGHSVELLFTNLMDKMVIEIKLYKKNYKRLKSLFSRETPMF